jgi:hypothetical protein
VDDAAWAALTLSLTVLGAIWTWWSFRRRGIASGLRALAFTLLPLAAYLTRTLRMFTRIVNAVADWATSLVLDPRVWTGIVVAGLSVVLFLVSGALRARGVGTRPGKRADKRAEKRAATGGDAVAGQERASRLPRSGGPGGRPAVDGDDDMAEIEALLRKRGIS